MPGDRIEHGAVIPVELIPTLRASAASSSSRNPPSSPSAATSTAPTSTPTTCRTCGGVVRCSPAGVGVAAGTDAPFGDPNPWRAVAAARDRTTPSGAVLGPDERIPAARALDLFLTPARRPGRPAAPRRARRPRRPVRPRRPAGPSPTRRHPSPPPSRRRPDRSPDHGPSSRSTVRPPRGVGAYGTGMDLGVCVASKVDDIDHAVLAEQLGYSHLWFADSQMLWSDCYATMALAAGPHRADPDRHRRRRRRHALQRGDRGRPRHDQPPRAGPRVLRRRLRQHGDARDGRSADADRRVRALHRGAAPAARRRARRTWRSAAASAPSVT